MYQNDTEKELLRTAVENVNAVRGNSQKSQFIEQLDMLAEEITDRDRLVDLADDLQFLASDIDGVDTEWMAESALC